MLARKTAWCKSNNLGQAAEGFPFPDNTFDTVLLAAVIGEVPDKQACVRSLGRILKPGGQLVFAEAFPDPDRIGVQDLRNLAEPEDFAFVEATGNRWRDFVRFRKLESAWRDSNKFELRLRQRNCRSAPITYRGGAWSVRFSMT